MKNLFLVVIIGGILGGLIVWLLGEKAMLGFLIGIVWGGIIVAWAHNTK